MVLRLQTALEEIYPVLSFQMVSMVLHMGLLASLLLNGVRLILAYNLIS